MFEALLRSILAPSPSALAAPDAQLALSALLVRVARADGEYRADEAAKIDRVLMQAHGLSPEQATTLRQRAEVLEAEAPDTVRFTRALKDATALEDRTNVLSGLWSIALADGVRDAHEDRLLRLVANLLGLTDVESALARKKAAKS